MGQCGSGIKEVHRSCLPEGPDRPAPPDGGQRAADQKGLRGGSAAGGVYADAPRVQSEADHGRDVGVGRALQGATERSAELAKSASIRCLISKINIADSINLNTIGDINFRDFFLFF